MEFSCTTQLQNVRRISKLTSNAMLLQAASGLERLMTGTKSKQIQDYSVAHISAVLYYKANVVEQLEQSKSFKEGFRKIVFSQIQKDFGDYIDAQARSKPKSLHHVYEWKNVGEEKSRLFKLKQIPSDGLSFKIGYSLLDSKSVVPGSYKRQYVFKNKAIVMEKGSPVNISPKNANRIVFEGKDGIVFMPIGKSVTVKRPGGPATKNSFVAYHKRWFSGNLINESIKRSGFHKAFGVAFKQALTVPASLKQVKYSFSPGSIRREASVALEREFGRAML